MRLCGLVPADWKGDIKEVVEHQKALAEYVKARFETQGGKVADLVGDEERDEAMAVPRRRRPLP